jgi:hypothetical protein
LAATDCLMQANEGETHSIRTPLLWLCLFHCYYFSWLHFLESPIRPTPPCLHWCYMQPTATSTDSPCFGYASQVFSPSGGSTILVCHSRVVFIYDIIKNRLDQWFKHLTFLWLTDPFLSLTVIF